MNDLTSALRVLTRDEVLELVQTLFHDDYQVAVLRGQLLVEVRLIELLAMRFPGFEELAPSIDFAKKLGIALRAKLIPELLYQALMDLARLRNKFSHPPLKLTITEEDERQFLKRTPPWYVSMLDVAVEDHGPALSPVGRKTRLLIGLLCGQLIATNITMRENPGSSLTEPIFAPPKEWVRNEFRMLDKLAEKGELPVVTPPESVVPSESADLAKLKRDIESLPRDDRAMLRPWMLAHYEEDGSRHCKIHDKP